MITISDKVENKIIRVTQDTTLLGMFVGDVILEEGIVFYAKGTIIGNVSLNARSNMVLNGTINGNIIKMHESAIMKIYGMVNGRILERNNNLYIDPKAIINHS